MKQMTFAMGLACSLLLAGCSSTDWWGETATEQAPAEVDKVPQMQVVNIMTQPENEMADDADMDMSVQRGDGVMRGIHGQPQYANTNGVYNGRMLTKHVGDYVQNMTQDLIGNMEYLSDKTPVGVTNFALIDSDLQSTNLLGFQMAESFMHELHKFRIPVIDYKATDYIRVTTQGDFVLTRDFLELSNSAPIEYILTGTMARHQGGYLVNARILGLQSKVVVASAQMLVPFYVVDALLPSEQDTRDGIQLRQGE